MPLVAYQIATSLQMDFVHGGALDHTKVL